MSYTKNLTNKVTPAGNRKYAVYTNSIIVGEAVSASSLGDLLGKMLKRQKNYWQVIKYKDDENRTIQVSREFWEDQGMSFAEIVEDWLEYANEDDLEEEITVLK